MPKMRNILFFIRWAQTLCMDRAIFNAKLDGYGRGAPPPWVATIFHKHRGWTFRDVPR